MLYASKNTVSKDIKQKLTDQKEEMNTSIIRNFSNSGQTAKKKSIYHRRAAHYYQPLDLTDINRILFKYTGNIKKKRPYTGAIKKVNKF